ncbi:MAG: immunity 50 family protein [Armatimonadetes bacterium]|nr:immunity 50 family protein [Armatimonadota bacterium]
MKEIYGYWPTLHDAVVRCFEMSFDQKAISLTLDYSDLISESDEESRSTRFTLRWSGVKEATLRMYANDLYGIDFTVEQDMILTKLENYTWGMDGFILASSVEIFDIQESPTPPEDPHHPYHHEAIMQFK